jgi:hypothetical protein
MMATIDGWVVLIMLALALAGIGLLALITWRR